MQAGGQRFESVILHPAPLRGEFFDILEQKGKQHEKAEGMRGAPRQGGAPHGKKQERAHGGCLWLRKAMKDVASCEKPR